jgi:PHP family Zn ribbon phosphoesterase
VENRKVSVFSPLSIRDSEQAFLNAICRGLKEPFNYMYMYSNDGHDYFKHIVTREYISFEQEVLSYERAGAVYDRVDSEKCMP